MGIHIELLHLHTCWLVHINVCKYKYADFEPVKLRVEAIAHWYLLRKIHKLVEGGERQTCAYKASKKVKWKT